MDNIKMLRNLPNDECAALAMFWLEKDEIEGFDRLTRDQKATALCEAYWERYYHIKHYSEKSQEYIAKKYSEE